MKKIAVITDSNSGITQAEAKEHGVFVLPMPFAMDDKLYFEDIDMTQELFYNKLLENADISTSQPALGSVMDLWDGVLKEHDEIVHIPMSSGLSASYHSADVLSREYGGRVFVVNNQRISVTLRQSVMDAVTLTREGWDGAQIKEHLEREKFGSSIYIMVDTLKYLKKGGRVTAAAAAVGSILDIKPVLQIQGEKLDAFSKARGVKQAKKILIDAMRADFEGRFREFAAPDSIWLQAAYTYDKAAALDFKREIKDAFPGFEVHMDPLSLSISCHIGPGALAIACTKKLKL